MMAQLILGGLRQSIAISLLALCVNVSQGQKVNPPQTYQDSLARVEKQIEAFSKSIATDQALLKQVGILEADTVLLHIITVIPPLAEALGGNGTALQTYLDAAQKPLEQIIKLKGKLAPKEESLLKLQQSETKPESQLGNLQKQIAKDKQAIAKIETPLLLDARDLFGETRRRLEKRIVDTKRLLGLYERLRIDLKHKIEMENVYGKAAISIVRNRPSSLNEFLKSYVLLMESAQRDSLHSYETLYAAAQQIADSIFIQDLLRRYRSNAALIPPGRVTLGSGYAYRTNGFSVSRSPITQPMLVIYRIATGERSRSFGFEVKDVVERPAKNIPTDIRRSIANRLGGRPITDEEREYINASRFTNITEKKRYNVVTSIYELTPEPEYTYVCWDVDLTDADVRKRLQEQTMKADSQVEEVMIDAWQTGQVWNPKRFLIDVNAMGLGYFIQHTTPWSTSALSFYGLTVVRPALTIGYRYAIDGTELSGERYGYIGVQVAYLHAFGRVMKTDGSATDTSLANLPTDISSMDLKGVEVTLLSTLGRAFYIGFGVGTLTYSLQGTVDLPNGTSLHKAERSSATHFVVPIGLLIRISPSFALNLGGTLWWKGFFTKPSAAGGLGFNIDIPLIRLGD